MYNFTAILYKLKKKIWFGEAIFQIELCDIKSFLLVSRDTILHFAAGAVAYTLMWHFYLC